MNLRIMHRIILHLFLVMHQMVSYNPYKRYHQTSLCSFQTIRERKILINVVCLWVPLHSQPWIKQIIFKSNSEKIFGVKIDSEVDFNNQLIKIQKNSSQRFIFQRESHCTWVSSKGSHWWVLLSKWVILSWKFTLASKYCSCGYSWGGIVNPFLHLWPFCALLHCSCVIDSRN